ncbi:MAG: hypothetical protein U0Q55_22045 [Vicinamibacterales bacterium]
MSASASASQNEQMVNELEGVEVVRVAVAHHQTAIDEQFLVSFDHAGKSRVAGIDDADGRQQQVGGIGKPAVQRLGEEPE